MASVGPEDGSLLVRTSREGFAAKAGHDLVLEVTRWEATLDGGRASLTADPRSLRVREALHGVKQLTEGDREEILRTIDAKVLRGKPIAFAGTVSEQEGGMLIVDGDLTLAGTKRAVVVNVGVEDGRARTTYTVRQSDWGIEPYRGLMGALRVRDAVQVVLDVRLPGR